MATTQLKHLIKDALAAIPWQTALQPTLPAKKVSVVLHEPAILGGYRVPHQPWKYYFFSLFQLHNETVNVWSHLIGFCIILHKLYGYFQEFDIYTDKILSTLSLFGLSCLIGLMTSAMVHLLHAKSPYVHFVAFMIDYIGACACSFGSGILCFYGLSERTIYRQLETVFVPLLTLASFLNCVNLLLAKIWYGHDPHNMKRKYMFITGMGIQAFMNMAPFVPRYYICYHEESCSMSSLNYATVITVIFVLEAIAFEAHQPERTCPGKFDIIGHGHQWFHLLIVVNHVLQLDAAYDDHINGYNSHADPNLVLILGVMVAMFVLELLVVYAMLPLVPASLRRVKRAEAAHKTH